MGADATESVIPDSLIAHADLWASKDPTSAFPKHVNSTHSSTTQPPKPAVPGGPSVFSRLDSVEAHATERHYPQQQMPTVPVSEPVLQPDTKPRTMAEIESEMQAALRQQRLLQQQQQLERLQAEREQQILREQLLRQEERRLYEQEQARLREQQALQDPLWAIRQTMIESNGMLPPSHEKRPSIPGSSPMTQQRKPMPPNLPMQGGSMGPINPAHNQMILHELLFQQQQQQQQQFLDHRVQIGNQHHELERNDVAMNAESQRRMVEAETKHRRRIAKIQAMVCLSPAV